MIVELYRLSLRVIQVFPNIISTSSLTSNRRRFSLTVTEYIVLSMHFVTDYKMFAQKRTFA